MFIITSKLHLLMYSTLGGVYSVYIGIALSYLRALMCLF